MPNYKQENLEGEISKWVRTNRIEFINTINQPVLAVFHQEEVIQLPSGQLFTTPKECVTYTMFDMNVNVPIIDINTYDPTENTFKLSDLYGLIASSYLWVARSRDASLQGMPNPIEEEPPVIPEPLAIPDPIEEEPQAIPDPIGPQP